MLSLSADPIKEVSSVQERRVLHEKICIDLREAVPGTAPTFSSIMHSSCGLVTWRHEYLVNIAYFFGIIKTILENTDVRA